MYTSILLFRLQWWGYELKCMGSKKRVYPKDMNSGLLICYFYWNWLHMMILIFNQVLQHHFSTWFKWVFFLNRICKTWARLRDTKTNQEQYLIYLYWKLKYEIKTCHSCRQLHDAKNIYIYIISNNWLCILETTMNLYSIIQFALYWY